MRRKIPATLEEMVGKKGWNLAESADGKPNGKRTVPKILKDVEARMNYTGEELEKRGSDKPRETLKRIMLVQSQLNQRILADRNKPYSACISMMRMVADWAPFSGGHYAMQLYRKNPLQLVVEQSSLTGKLMDYFLHSTLEMASSSKHLEEQHTAAFRQINHWKSSYKNVQKEISNLLEMEKTAEAEKSNIDSVQLLYLNDKIFLEKQSLQNRLNESAMNAKKAYDRTVSITEYLSTVNEAKQVLSNAYSSLEQVAASQETTQTALAAFMHGQKDLVIASQAVEKLSDSVTTAHSVLSSVSHQIKETAGKIAEKREKSESADSDAKQLYATTHKMNNDAFEGVHDFMRKLDTNPSELLPGKRNGYHAEAAQE